MVFWILSLVSLVPQSHTKIWHWSPESLITAEGTKLESPSDDQSDLRWSFILEDSSSSRNSSILLDPDSLRGGSLLLAARCLASVHTPRHHPWNGPKVMLVLKDSAGQTNRAQLSWSERMGQQPWIRSQLLVQVSPSLKSARLVLGIEAVRGKVLFDSVSVQVWDRASPPPRPSTTPIEHWSTAPLRGATWWNQAPSADTSSLEEFKKQWKGNLLRWHLNPPGFRSGGLQSPKFDTDLENEVRKLEQALPICKSLGIKVIVAPHTFTEGLFVDHAAQSRLIHTWRNLVSRLQGHPAILGWDLANEPEESQWTPGLLTWFELSDTLARVIRSIDTQHFIVVESSDRASPLAFSWLRPLGWDRNWDLKRIVYSFHFYEPGEVTHQGVLPQYPIGSAYPSEIRETWWDRTQLEKTVEPVVQFQKKYRVPVWVGEFSCVRWAPNGSAKRWLSDAVSIFEKNGWDWTYHAFREYNAWNLECSDQINDKFCNQRSDRLQVIKNGLQKNEDYRDDFTRTRSKYKDRKDSK